MRKSRFTWMAVYLVLLSAAITLAYRAGTTTSRYASDVGYSVAPQLLEISSALSKPQLPRTVAADPPLALITPRAMQPEIAVAEAVPESESCAASLACWERLGQAEADVARSRTAYLTAQSRLVIERVKHERELAAARLRLRLVRMDQSALLNHRHRAAKSEQADVIHLAERRCEQAQTRLQWSQRLADRALISQAALETDEAAAERRRAELKMARNQMKVLEDSTFAKQTLELESAVGSLERDLAQLTMRQANEVRQLESVVRVKRGVLEEAVAELDAARALCGDQLRRDDLDTTAVPLVLTAHRRVIDQLNEVWLGTQQEMRRQREQSATSTAQAEMQVRAARLALIEYLHGSYPQQRHAMLSEISDIQDKLARARQRFVWSKRVIAKGYVTQSHLEADKLVVAEYEAALKKANNKLEMLDEFTHQRSQLELQARLDQAQQELAREKRVCQDQIARLQAESAAAESQREYRFKLARQIAHDFACDFPAMEGPDVPGMASMEKAVVSTVGE